MLAPRASALLALAVLGSSCSALIVQPSECESPEPCRALFGFGSTCGDDGACQPVDLPARCEVFPEGALDDPSERVFFGLLYESAVEGDRRASRAATLAMELVNGVDEQAPFGLVSCDVRASGPGSGLDDELDRTEAVVAMGAFLAEQLQVEAVIGPSTSNDVRALYERVTLSSGTLVLSNGADASALTRLDGRDTSLLWRTVPPEDAMIEAAAESLKARSVASVFIVAPSGVRAETAGALRARLVESAPEVQVSERFYDDSTALVATLNEAASSDAQEIVLLADHVADAVRFIETAVGDTRLAGRQFLLNAVALDPALLASDSAGVFGRSDGEYQLRIVHPSRSESATSLNFRNFYRAAYNNEDPGEYPVAAATWDAVWLLMLAEVADRDAGILGGVGQLAAGLRALSSNDTPTPLEPTSWVRAREVLSEGGSLNVEGAASSLDYNGEDELEANAQVSAVDLVDGQWLFVDG